MTHNGRVTIPPDDLPRSPTGRVPEWVRLEAAGLPVPDTTWRARPPTPRRRRRRRGRGLAVVLVVLLALGGAWWARSPDPRAELELVTDPDTWVALGDAAGEVVERLLDQAVGGDAPDPVALPLPVPGSGDVPPPGLEEADTRLAPVAGVAAPSQSYAFAALQDDGVTPVAWSPCRPVRLVVNEGDAPAGFRDAVEAVAAEVGAATGLVLVVEGTTTEAPVAERDAHQPDRYGDRWAPVLVAVADEDAVPYLEGRVAGVASTYRAAAGGAWHLVSGAVYLDVAELDEGRGGAEPGWVAVLRHEMGHLVGLDHVDDSAQLMYPVTDSVRTFQAGDLTGLSILGQGACAPEL